MSDVFLSYAKEDRDRARVLAEALVAGGLTVWWDRIIPTGRVFDEVIEEELGRAGCAIVLWSDSSVKSRWVKVEAEAAIEQNKFLPVLIDRARIPLAFKHFQAADLVGWYAGAERESFERLVIDVRRSVGEAPEPSPRPPEPEPEPEPEPQSPVQPPSRVAPPPRGLEEAIVEVDTGSSKPRRRWIWAGVGLLALIAIPFVQPYLRELLSSPRGTPEPVIPPVSECRPEIVLHWPPQPDGDPQSFVDGCRVQVNGVVFPGARQGCPEPSLLLWSWGDGSDDESWFPAVHEYARDGGYAFEVAGLLPSGELLTAAGGAHIIGCHELWPEERPEPPPARRGHELESLRVPTPVVGGERFKGRIELHEVAGEDTEVSLEVHAEVYRREFGVPDEEAVVIVPPSVEIPRGEREVDFDIATEPVAGDAMIGLVARIGESEASAILHVMRRPDPDGMSCREELRHHFGHQMEREGAACFELGMRWLEGTPTSPPNEGRARELFQRACDHGLRAGCERVGW